MGANQWYPCRECEAQGLKPGYHPALALYVRPPGKQTMVRVGWLLRCGHVIIQQNPAEAIR